MRWRINFSDSPISASAFKQSIASTSNQVTVNLGRTVLFVAIIDIRISILLVVTFLIRFLAKYKVIVTTLLYLARWPWLVRVKHVQR